jgi:hypothetical protein
MRKCPRVWKGGSGPEIELTHNRPELFGVGICVISLPPLLSMSSGISVIDLLLDLIRESDIHDHMRQFMEADILAIRPSSTQIGIIRLFEQVALTTSSNRIS